MKTEACEKYLEMISSFVDGELDETEINALNAHIKTCPSCSRIMGTYLTVSHELQEMESQPDDDFTQSVMTKILKDAPKQRPKAKKIYFRRLISAAAVLAIVVWGSGIWRALLPDGSSDSSMSISESGEVYDTDENVVIENYENSAVDSKENSDEAESELDATPFTVTTDDENAIIDEAAEPPAEPSGMEAFDVGQFLKVSSLEISPVSDGAADYSVQITEPETIKKLLTQSGIADEPEQAYQYELLLNTENGEICVYMWIVEDGVIIKESNRSACMYVSITAEELAELVELPQ